MVQYNTQRISYKHPYGVKKGTNDQEVQPLNVRMENGRFSKQSALLMVNINNDNNTFMHLSGISDSEVLFKLHIQYIHPQ